MAAQNPKRRGSAEPTTRRTVMASVRIDASVYTKVGVAASLEGIDKSAFMSRVITQAVQGIVVFDRRKSAGAVTVADEGIGTDEA